MDEESVTTRISDLLAPAAGGPEADAPHPAYLIVVSGGIPGAMLRLSPGCTRLGRAPDNTYQLRGTCVSRYHAALRAEPNGGVWLSDLASTNGTFHNGRRLPCHSPVRLKDGDRIQFGPSALVKFVCLDPSEERFQRELFERTVRDALTGLYNREFFLSQVGPLAERGSARRLGLALLMLDIDHFKRVNDTLGHDGGDAVLREVAQVLRDATRPEDLVARYGGEEFIVALPVAAPELARERAERIRAALAARRIRAGGASLRVTASLGLAYAPPGRAGAVRALIAQADQCLYRAKRAGRNRVVFQHSSTPKAPEPSTEEVDAAVPVAV